MLAISPADALDLYIANLEAEGYVRPATLADYRYHIGRFFRDVALPPTVRELTGKHVLAWTAAMRKRGLKPGGIRSYQSSVWIWLGWLFREGYVAVDISRQVRRTRPDDATVTRRTASPDVIDRLLMVAQARGEWGYRNRAIILMFAATGARKAELAACHLSDFDAEAGTLHLWRHTKTGEERWCGVDAKARYAMLLYLKHERKGTGDGLFLQRQGKAMSENAITCMLRSLAESAGLECTAHDFRRACAARMLAAGALPDVVQYQLGHKTAALTLQYGREARRERSLAEYHALDRGVRRLRA